MDALISLFEAYGLLLVFGAVVVEQLGPPIPSGPLLIVAGALAIEGGVSVVSVAGVAWTASMIGKVALYVVGKKYGKNVMGVLCRMAVAPDTCMDRTSNRFERWGAALLIVAEFLPGVRTIAPALAGAEKLRPAMFLFYSALGAALWTALYLGIGLLFREQIDRAMAVIEQSGKAAAVVIATALAAYLAVKWWRRRRAVKSPA